MNICTFLVQNANRLLETPEDLSCFTPSPIASSPIVPSPDLRHFQSPNLLSNSIVSPSEQTFVVPSPRPLSPGSPNYEVRLDYSESVKRVSDALRYGRDVALDRFLDILEMLNIASSDTAVWVMSGIVAFRRSMEQPESVSLGLNDSASSLRRRMEQSESVSLGLSDSASSLQMLMKQSESMTSVLLGRIDSALSLRRMMEQYESMTSVLLGLIVSAHLILEIVRSLNENTKHKVVGSRIWRRALNIHDSFMRISEFVNVKRATFTDSWLDITQHQWRTVPKFELDNVENTIFLIKLMCELRVEFISPSTFDLKQEHHSPRRRSASCETIESTNSFRTDPVVDWGELLYGYNQ